MGQHATWSDLQYVTRRVASLRLQRAKARANGDMTENERLSAEIVKTGIARDRLLAQLSVELAA